MVFLTNQKIAPKGDVLGQSTQGDVNQNFVRVKNTIFGSRQLPPPFCKEKYKVWMKSYGAKCAIFGRFKAF